MFHITHQESERVHRPESVVTDNSSITPHLREKYIVPHNVYMTAFLAFGHNATVSMYLVIIVTNNQINTTILG